MPLPTLSGSGPTPSLAQRSRVESETRKHCAVSTLVSRISSSFGRKGLAVADKARRLPPCIAYAHPVACVTTGHQAPNDSLLDGGQSGISVLEAEVTAQTVQQRHSPIGSRRQVQKVHRQTFLQRPVFCSSRLRATAFV
jgi:hypothetical protein